jgi:hypothetical protein
MRYQLEKQLGKREILLSLSTAEILKIRINRIHNIKDM